MRQGTAQEKRDRGRKGRGGAQLLRSSKFVGFEQTVNWAQQPQQTAKPPTYPSPNHPSCIWQFDNNAGAQAQWGKHIDHGDGDGDGDCDCPMQMKLCSAALMCLRLRPPPLSLPLAMRN